MAVYLVQHGLSLPKTHDRHQALSRAGRAEVERIAVAARDYRIPVARILHSGKLRAQQTAEILCAHLAPAGGVAPLDDMGPNDDVIAFAERLDPESNDLYVGHLPFMGRLAAYLLTGTTQRPIIRFQNAGIVCLAQAEAFDGWVIKWALMPKID